MDTAAELKGFVPTCPHDGGSLFAVVDTTGGGCGGANPGRATEPASGPRRLWRQIARGLGDAQTSHRHPGSHEAQAHIRALRSEPGLLVIGLGRLGFGQAGDCVVQTTVAFDEVAAGIAMGNGSALARAIGGALQSASGTRAWRVAAHTAGLIPTPPLRLLGSLLRYGADAASGCLFFGRLRADGSASGRTLVQSFRQSFGPGPRQLPEPL